MEISPHSLNVLLTLSEVKNFTLSAKRLGMTQPGVSQHIKILEEYFACNLINRFGKKFEMTPEGIKVLKYAKNLFSTHENFKNSLKNDDELSGIINMASPGAIGIKLYSLVLKLSKKNKGLIQHFYYAPNKSIEVDLLSDNLDIGFMSKKPMSELLEYSKLTTEELLLITPKAMKGRSYNDLINLGFINHPDGKDMLIKLFAPNFKKEFRGFESIKLSGGNNQIGRILEPVCAEMGFTVLPHFAFESFPEKNKLRIFPLPKKVYNTIYIVKKKYKILPKRYDYMLEFIKSHID